MAPDTTTRAIAAGSDKLELIYSLLRGNPADFATEGGILTLQITMLQIENGTRNSWCLLGSTAEGDWWSGSYHTDTGKGSLRKVPASNSEAPTLTTAYPLLAVNEGPGGFDFAVALGRGEFTVFKVGGQPTKVVLNLVRQQSCDDFFIAGYLLNRGTSPVFFLGTYNPTLRRGQFQVRP